MGFCECGAKKNLRQFIVRSSHAHRAFQVYLLIKEQAGSQVAGGCEAKAIARGTEMIGECADKADFTRGSLKPETFCWAIKCVFGNMNQPPKAAELFFDQGVRYMP